jgi:protein-tyrosine phosphatase
MGFLFHRKKGHRDTDLSALGCDMHSHLIPGVDDGVKDMEEAMAIIRGLMALGYKKLITTPHILWNIYPNTPDTIGAGYRAVAAEIERQKLPVVFSAAAEYLMDDHFDRQLDAGVSLLTLKDKMVLVELSFVVPAINLKQLLFKLQIKGYQPVLAHPERYLYFAANKGWYDQIRDTGCLFQLNLLSLAGYYGKSSRELAQYLVRKKYVDLLGTDLHHERHLEFLHNTRGLGDMVNRLVDAGLARNAQLLM